MSNRALLTLLMAVVACLVALTHGIGGITVALSIVVIAGTAHLGRSAILHVMGHSRASRVKRIASDSNHDVADLPPISILVAAINEERVIAHCVHNLLSLDYPNFELCVIDDNSTDRTLEILFDLRSAGYDFQIIRRAPGAVPGKSAALNEGLRKTDSRLVAVFDADAFVERDFLRKLVAEITPPHVAAVQAQKRIYDGQTSLLAQCQIFEYAADTFLQAARMVVGGAAELRGNGQLIKRAALFEVGGWNELAITDDLDLSTRFLIKGWSTRIVPSVHVYEEGIETIAAWYRQRKRWVEGSIRRYLDHGFAVLTSAYTPISSKVDFISWIIELITPPLIAAAGISLFVRSLSTPAAANAIGSGTEWYVFWINCVAAPFALLIPTICGIVLYENNQIKGNCLAKSLITLVYIFVLWPPCVVVSVFNIMCKKNASRWKSSEHQGNLMPRSISPAGETSARV